MRTRWMSYQECPRQVPVIALTGFSDIYAKALGPIFVGALAVASWALRPESRKLAGPQL